MKLFKPEVFQGSLSKKHYFEGWYFKHVSEDLSQVYSFIPGMSLNPKDPHAFIQIINGITGETHYINYNIKQFSFEKDKLWVKIGDSVFTNNGINLNIKDPNISIQGELKYSNLSPYPKTLVSPGIMGWYSYMPFMECYHGVVSANHIISGQLNVNNSTINFNNAKGYIEKDWGTSFPECWIWLQSNSFKNNTTCLFVSIAKIPWIGKHFMGFIAFLYYKGEYIKFCTYNHAKLTKTSFNENNLCIALKNSKYELKINTIIKNSGELIAPTRGNMERRIKESIDSIVSFTLFDQKGNIIVTDESDRAGLEIIEKIFDYL